MASQRLSKLNFFALWSIAGAPRQFIGNSSKSLHQVSLPLPLPKYLVIFGLGEWTSISSVNVEVEVGEKTQKIGTLSLQNSWSLTWDGDWDPEVVAAAQEGFDEGVYGKIKLKVCREDKAGFVSRTPMGQRKKQRVHLIPEQRLVDSQTPHKTMDMTAVHARRGQPMGPSFEGAERRRTKKIKISGEENLKQQDSTAACPSARWRHGMCLTDHDTAVVIGGEASATGQAQCLDSLWKLDTANDHWVSMNSFASGPMPSPATGHSATYDPESNLVYVYGGFGQGDRYSDIYILNTLCWKWELVTAAGKIPRLAHHAAVVYTKELYVFGGVQPSRGAGMDLIPSNVLYIFNPDFKLWYKPIVEGKPPLSRFGHSMTLLSKKLFIFGGQKTATAYLNDLTILDLAYMEYSTVKYENMPPPPRGFHAALPVANNRLLISGGLSSTGTLQDAHIFNIDTNLWTSLVNDSSPLTSTPRAGHSIIHLGTAILTDDEKRRQNEECTGYPQACSSSSVLVFGGSDGCGLHHDTLRCHVEIPL